MPLIKDLKIIEFIGKIFQIKKQLKIVFNSFVCYFQKLINNPNTIENSTIILFYNTR